MKILLVNDYGTPTGGAEIQFIGMREQLRARGHDVRLFTSSARSTATTSTADYECFGTTSRWRTLLQTANPWAAQHLRRVLNEFRPDVVHVKIFLTQLSPLILPLLRDIPSLYHVVWYRPICPTGTKMLPDGRICHSRPGVVCHRERCLPLHDWLPLMLQLRLWRHWRDVFNLIVANSNATRRRLIAEGITPVDVIWNGVAPRPMRPALPTEPLVVCAGRLVWEKGFDTLVRAFHEVAQRIPNARLSIIGEGPEKAPLQALVNELGLQGRVSLPGRMDRAALERACEAAWVQAAPSRWDEPFGIVAAEAAMRGTAAIVSNTGGLAEIVVDGQTGYQIPPNDETALRNSLLALLSNRELAEHMGHAAHQRAMVHFNETLVADHFLDRYRQIVGR
jgi:glycosyltransferase involved in cell wall biosynthesis